MNFPEMTEQQVKFFLFDCAILVAHKLNIDIYKYNDSNNLVKAIEEKADIDSHEIAEALNSFRFAYLKWFEVANNEKQDINISEVITLITERDNARQVLVDVCSKA